MRNLLKKVKYTPQQKQKKKKTFTFLRTSQIWLRIRLCQLDYKKKKYCMVVWQQGEKGKRKKISSTQPSQDVEDSVHPANSILPGFLTRTHLIRPDPTWLYLDQTSEIILLESNLTIKYPHGIQLKENKGNNFI